MENPWRVHGENYGESMAALAALNMRKTRVVFTGDGRVASGVREVLEQMELKGCSPQEFISQPPRGSYFTQLTPWDLYHRKDGFVSLMILGRRHASWAGSRLSSAVKGRVKCREKGPRPPTTMGQEDALSSALRWNHDGAFALTRHDH